MGGKISNISPPSLSILFSFSSRKSVSKNDFHSLASWRDRGAKGRHSAACLTLCEFPPTGIKHGRRGSATLAEKRKHKFTFHPQLWFSNVGRRGGHISQTTVLYFLFLFFRGEPFPPVSHSCANVRGGETSLRSACSPKQRAFHNCFLSPPSPDQQQVEVSAEHTHIHNMQPYIMRAILT